jgi:hypothetical protein
MLNAGFEVNTEEVYAPATDQHCPPPRAFASVRRLRPLWAILSQKRRQRILQTLSRLIAQRVAGAANREVPHEHL